MFAPAAVVGVCGFDEDAAFFLGADLRRETPTLALSLSPFVITPGAGRLLRRVAILGPAEPRGEADASSSPTLPRRKLVRRFGGSSLTALLALRISVGRLGRVGVAARRVADG